MGESESQQVLLALHKAEINIVAVHPSLLAHLLGASLVKCEKVRLFRETLDEMARNALHYGHGRRKEYLSMIGIFRIAHPVQRSLTSRTRRRDRVEGLALHPAHSSVLPPILESSPIRGSPLPIS
jgi:hypothetical protein